MKAQKFNALNEIARITCSAGKEVLESATGSNISHSSIVQRIPVIHLKPDIGCFVQFYGDYSGLFIMNFSAEAGLELYRLAMTYMGLPEEELATSHTSDDVVNYIGELVNQVTGKIRRAIEERFDLTANNNQPKAIAISSAIKLSIATQLNSPKCRRLSFKTAGLKSFYIEISMEETEFIQLFPLEKEENKDEFDIDFIMNQNKPKTEERSTDNSEPDIDAIMAGQS